MNMAINNLKPFLESVDIYFIPMDEDIHDDYFKWINDRTIIENLETGQFPKSKQQLMNYVKSVNDNPNYVFFAVIEKKTKIYIGNAKLGPIDWLNRTAEYGRIIGEESAQGKGYGTAIAELLLHYAFMILNLNKVTAGALADNMASIKSNEKVGLEIEGKLKQQIFKNGKYKDAIRMGITRARYNELIQIANK
jgi:[ribosomal protein S5]-alanine N-acetyltransferase